MPLNILCWVQHSPFSILVYINLGIPKILLSAEELCKLR